MTALSHSWLLAEDDLTVWLLVSDSSNVNSTVGWEIITLHTKLSGAVYCYRSCLWACLQRAGGVCLCGSVTTITRNCMHESSPHWVSKGSDHLQLVKFWPSCAPGRGSAAGRKFLAPPYYSQRAVFASPVSAFFIICWVWLKSRLTFFIFLLCQCKPETWDLPDCQIARVLKSYVVNCHATVVRTTSYGMGMHDYGHTHKYTDGFYAFLRHIWYDCRDNQLITLALASSAVYCNQSCLFVCVCGSVTMITRNCMHQSSPNWVCRWR